MAAPGERFAAAVAVVRRFAGAPRRRPEGGVGRPGFFRVAVRVSPARSITVLVRSLFRIAFLERQSGGADVC